jgi:hypothetical protein
MKEKRSFRLTTLILVAVLFFAAGIAIPVGIYKLWNKAIVREIELIKDIDIEKDDLIEGTEANVKGTLKKGSIGRQTMRKGNRVYIEFPVVLNADKIEYKRK